MKIWVTIAGVLLMSSSAVFAQQLVFSPSQTRNCLNGATTDGKRRACIGASKTACSEATDLGKTSLGTSECTRSEFRWWDLQLDNAYDRLRSIKRSQDQAMAGLGGSMTQIEALLEMQRAWLTYRDAKCEFAHSQSGSGIKGETVFMSCMMYETAEQTFYLQDMTNLN